MDYFTYDGETVNKQRIIYTPSEFAIKSLLYLQEIGTLKAVKKHKSERNNLDSYLFLIVLSGTGWLYYQGKRRRISQGDCVFIDCKDPYFHQTSSNLWSLQWVHFNGSNMKELYKRYILNKGSNILRPESIAEYQALLERIFESAKTNDPISDIQLNEELTSLMTRILKHPLIKKSKRESQASQRVEAIKQFIDNSFRSNLSLEKLSQEFFINKFYLERVFKRQYGITVYGYILRLRVTAAKEMLRFSNSSISEIGMAVGFKDQNYFSRVFKSVEKISPSQYRKLW